MCDFVNRLKSVASYKLGGRTVAYLFVLRTGSEVQHEKVEKICEEIEQMEHCTTQDIQDEKEVSDTLKRAAFGEGLGYLWA